MQHYFSSYRQFVNIISYFILIRLEIILIFASGWKSNAHIWWILISWIWICEFDEQQNIWLELKQKNIFVNLHKKIYWTIFNVQGRDAQFPSLHARQQPWWFGRIEEIIFYFSQLDCSAFLRPTTCVLGKQNYSLDVWLDSVDLHA